MTLALRLKRIFSIEIETCSILVGSLVAGGALAIASFNSGGAWDNAKRYIEAGQLDHGGYYETWPSRTM